MAYIGIDIGHGSDTFPNNGKGVYRGGKGYAEHSFNAKLGMKIKSLLEAKGHRTLLGQPPNQPDVPLSSRTNLYNREKIDLVLSVHANYNSNPAVDGRCAFYWHTGTNSKRWAELIIEEIRKKGYSTHGTGLHAGVPGTWTELHINRECNMPAVLTEHGFMGNDKDFELIFGSKQDKYIQDMADAQVNAVQRYLGLSVGGKWTQNDFLKSIKSGAVASWKKHKVLPSLVGAQAALESGWGTSGLAKDGKNLFGIKADSSWKGKVYTANTKEFVNGSWITTKASFRAYDSWADSVEDHGAFFSSTDFRKDNYKAVIGETNYKKAVAAILEPVAKSGYATDPNYASKIISIIEEWGLAEWDNEAFGEATASPTAPSIAKKSTDTIAQEVIAGKWGTGDDRKKRLTNAGYNYTTIQNRVNKLLGATTTSTKSIDTLAKEVIAGQHGTGDARKKALGSQYDAVQKRVNELLGATTTTNKVTKTYVQLSKNEPTWRVYRLGSQPVAGNEVGFLAPGQYSGLEYEVLGYENDGTCAIIQTQAFGKAKIYIKDPSAKIVKK